MKGKWEPHRGKIGWFSLVLPLIKSRSKAEVDLPMAGPEVDPKGTFGIRKS